MAPQRQLLLASLRLTVSDDTIPVVEQRDLPPSYSRGDSTVWAGVLAAGRSNRFGRENKLLIELSHKPLVQHAIDTVACSSVDGVTVVLGHEHERVKRAVADANVEFVINRSYHAGQSSSVAEAVRAAKSHDADAVLIMLGDMPAIETRSVNLLVDAYRRDVADILVAGVDGQRGNPVLFDARFFDSLVDISGDRGARNLLVESDETVLLDTEDTGVTHDVDSPSDVDP